MALETRWFFGMLLEKVTALLALPWALLKPLRDWLHFARLANRFPGPRPLPIIGNLLACGLPISATSLFDRLALEEMPQHRNGQFWIGPFRTFFLNVPEDIKYYLQNPKNQSKEPLMYKMLASGIGSGLITENGEKWRLHHKIILPTFHMDVVNSYVPIIDRTSDIFVQLLRNHAHGSVFNVRPMAQRFTLDTTLATIFGVPSNFQEKQDDVLHFTEEGSLLISYRQIRPWLYPDIFFYNCTSVGSNFAKARNEMRMFSEKIIRSRQKILETKSADSDSCGKPMNGKKQRNGFLDELLVQMKDGVLSYEEVIDEVNTFILAGFDTTNILIYFTMFCLAKNFHIQEKVITELKNVFEEHKNEEMSLKMLQSMEYLDMVLKETLRMYPPVWMTMRVTGEDTPLFTENLVVPAGAHVMISAKSVHMDARVFPRPREFDPQRFSRQGSPPVHPFAFLPFGVGARACIGRKFAMIQAKAVLSKVLWNFKILPDPSYEPELAWGVSAVPHNGMRLKFLPRQ